MQLTVSGHHIEVTSAMKDYVETRFNKLDRHFDNITGTNVTLTMDSNTPKAEANLQVGGATIHANSSNQDMYAAIDNLSDKLDRQLLKHKEKVRSHR